MKEIIYRRAVRFPKDLINNQSIQSVTFEYCTGGVLADEIGTMSNLEHLEFNLERLEQKELPDSIGQLTNLKTLVFKKNCVPTLPKTIGNLKQLKKLHLSTWNRNSGLQNLPVEIGGLTALEDFYIYQYQLKTLPDSVGQWQNIQKVQISAGPLTALPSTINGWKTLKTLTIANSNLEIIPSEIGELTELETLNLNGNPIKELPASLGQLKQLKVLSIHSKSLKTLPPEIGNLTELEELDLYNCKLTTLPASLGKLKKLKKLNLGNNQLTEFPAFIQQLTELTELILFRNQIKIVPMWVGNLKQLYKLGLSYNQLTDLPDSLRNLVNLKILSFNGNEFKTFPEVCIYLSLESIQFGYPALSPNYWYRDYDTFKKSYIKANLSPRLRLLFYNLYNYKNTSAITTLPISDLLELLRIKSKRISDRILGIIAAQNASALKATPITSGKSSLVLLGTLSFKKKELKERLANLNINCTTTIKQETTHVVVGPNMTRHKNSDLPHLVFLNEQDLKEFLVTAEEQFLMEDTPETKNSAENLSQFLLSLDEDNVLLGLEMLKSSGVPEVLMTDLFLIYKNPDFKNTTRKEAKNLIQLYGNDSVKSLLKWKYKLVDNNINHKNLERNVAIFTRSSGLDKVKIGQYLFDKNKCLNRFWLDTMTKPQRTQFIQQLLNQPIKGLTPVNGAYFSDITEVYQFTTAETVVLREARLKAFPKELFAFKQLKSLHLSKNNFKTLPDELVQLTQLEYLDLSKTKIATFPKVFDKMPNLKKIWLSGTPLVKNLANKKVKLELPFYTQDRYYSLFKRKE